MLRHQNMDDRKWFVVLLVYGFSLGECSKANDVVRQTCIPGFIPVNKSFFFASTGDGDESQNASIICGWGLYPGLQCNRWSEFFRTDLPPYPYFNGFFAGNISTLLGDWNLSYNSFGTGPLPESYAMLSNERHGILFSDCRDNKTNSAFSTPRCVDCSSPSPLQALLLYMALELVPVVLFCFLIGFLNLNVAHGFMHSFVFFYHMLPVVLGPLETFSSPGNFTLIYGKFLWGFVSLENSVMDVVNVSSLPCFVETQDPYFVRVLGYSKAVCVLGTMFLLLLMVLCNWCPMRMCRVMCVKVHQKIHSVKLKLACQNKVLHSVFSLCVLGYTVLLKTSFSVLSVSEIYYFLNTNSTYTARDLQDIQVPRFNGSIAYFTNSHQLYSIAAILVVLISLTFPVLLVLYPLIPQLYRRITKKFVIKRNRLDSVLESFQNTFKPNYSFFAGLYLLYRLVLWALEAFFPEVSQRFFLIQITLIIILSVHCIFRPFEDQKHNIVEMLHLINLNAILALSQKAYINNYHSQVSTYAEKVTLTVLISFLSLLPLLLLSLYCACVLARRCRTQCSGQTAYTLHHTQEMLPALGEDTASDDSGDTSNSDDYDKDFEELLT